MKQTIRSLCSETTVQGLLDCLLTIIIFCYLFNQHKNVIFLVPSALCALMLFIRDKKSLLAFFTNPLTFLHTIFLLWICLANFLYSGKYFFIEQAYAAMALFIGYCSYSLFGLGMLRFASLSSLGCMALYLWHAFNHTLPLISFDGRLSFLTHPVSVGLFMGFFTLANLILFFTQKSWRLFYLLALAASVYLLFQTNARASILITGIFAALILFRFMPIRPFLCAALVICSLSTAYLVTADNTHSERLVAAITSPLQDDTFISRTKIWDITVEAYQHTPWYGGGTRFYGEYHHSKYQQNPNGMERNVLFTHNIFLQILITGGYGLLGIFCLTLILYAWNIYRYSCYLAGLLILLWLSIGSLESLLTTGSGDLLVYLTFGINMACFAAKRRV